MLKEFKKFAMKGNVIDLAVGIIIGGAFGKIVSSLVNDIIMPLFGLLLGKIDFSNLSYNVMNGEAVMLSIPYGQFIQNVVDFLIISFSIFVIIRFINSLQREEEEAEKKEEPKPSTSEVLLLEIRDLLKANLDQE
ncbi:MAG: large-conductance mechanosensitive channel protein MscL [Limnochordia bacterium]|jgi:large conductance mechanosensitive channel|nr:large-conductance mechanosensitive channel protein MscL [Bacillota bacterium]